MFLCFCVCLGLQFAYSIITDNFTFITIFASVFSFLSILLTVFEYISANLLLRNESVLVIKMFVASNEISSLSGKKLKRFENLRKPISHEISKIINIDTHLIELLKPKQTSNGCYLIFHIRIGMASVIDAANNNTIQLIQKQVNSGRLAKSFYQHWNKIIHRDHGLHSISNGKLPKIQKLETKFLSAEQQYINGSANRDDRGNSAVIKMINTTNTNNEQAPTQAIATILTNTNSNFNSSNGSPIPIMDKVISQPGFSIRSSVETRARLGSRSEQPQIANTLVTVTNDGISDDDDEHDVDINELYIKSNNGIDDDTNGNYSFDYNINNSKGAQSIPVHTMPSLPANDHNGMLMNGHDNDEPKDGFGAEHVKGYIQSGVGADAVVKVGGKDDHDMTDRDAFVLNKAMENAINMNGIKKEINFKSIKGESGQNVSISGVEGM